MKEHLSRVAEFFKERNCTDVKVREINKQFGEVKADYEGKNILAYVQIKLSWGTSTKSTTIRDWDHDRYPYKSVQIILKKPTVEYTHYIQISGDNRRMFVCPKSAMDIAKKGHQGWSEENGEHDVVVSVLNWTERCLFYIKKEKWTKDENNIWVKPYEDPSDVDEFFASLKKKD